MKKIIICLLLVAVFPDVLAQTSFGLKGGLNLSTLNVADPAATYDSKTGYHLGIFVGGRGDKVGFQPELLLYTQNGEIQNTTFGTAQESFTYLTVPLIIKFYPILGLNLQIGPQFGFLL